MAILLGRSRSEMFYHHLQRNWAMSFKRTHSPEEFATGNQLTADMVGIGMKFSGKPSHAPNIEDTLIAASIEGVNGDYRVMSLLVDWLDIHSPRINANRLIKIIEQLSEHHL